VEKIFKDGIYVDKLPGNLKCFTKIFSVRKKGPQPHG